MKDSGTLNYGGNDELKAALGGKEPGEKCRITLDILVTANSDESFDYTVEGVEVEDSYEGETEEMPESSEESEDEDPVMVVVAKKK